MRHYLIIARLKRPYLTLSRLTRHYSTIARFMRNYLIIDRLMRHYLTIATLMRHYLIIDRLMRPFNTEKPHTPGLVCPPLNLYKCQSLHVNVFLAVIPTA